MYELRFEGDQAEERFDICHQSIVLSTKQIAVGEWDDVIALLRKIKSIGHPIEKVNGIQLYAKNDGDQAILLEKAEHKRLVDFIEQPIWRPQVLETVGEVREWLKEMKAVEAVKLVKEDTKTAEPPSA